MYNLLAQTQAVKEIIPVSDSLSHAKTVALVDNVKELVTNRGELEAFLMHLAESAFYVGLKIIAAVLVYFIGRWFINHILRLMDATFARRDIDLSLRSFLKSLVKILFYIVLLLCVIPFFGIEVTSVVALLASAGLAIGMALSGTLQNFAGGVMILLLKPYRVGDFISAQGQSGTVMDIHLFSTQIHSTDNQTIYIPNGAISTSIIDNYSAADTRRVDFKISLAYGDDFDVAKQTILEIINADKRILREPAEPFVALSELADSSINIVVRVWTANSDYWGVYFDLNELFYKELPKKGLNFPFPQMDVHIKQN